MEVTHIDRGNVKTVTRFKFWESRPLNNSPAVLLRCHRAAVSFSSEQTKCQHYLRFLMV